MRKPGRRIVCPCSAWTISQWDPISNEESEKGLKTRTKGSKCKWKMPCLHLLSDAGWVGGQGQNPALGAYYTSTLLTEPELQTWLCFSLLMTRILFWERTRCVYTPVSCPRWLWSEFQDLFSTYAKPEVGCCWSPPASRRYQNKASHFISKAKRQTSEFCESHSAGMITLMQYLSSRSAVAVKKPVPGEQHCSLTNNSCSRNILSVRVLATQYYPT